MKHRRSHPIGMLLLGAAFLFGQPGIIEHLLPVAEAQAKPSGGGSRSSGSRSSSSKSKSSSSSSKSKSSSSSDQSKSSGYGTASSSSQSTPANPGYGTATPSTPANPGYGTATPAAPSNPGYGTAATPPSKSSGYGTASPATPPSAPAKSGYGTATSQAPMSVGAPPPTKTSSRKGEVKISDARNREITTQRWKNSASTGGRPPTVSQATSTRTNRAASAYTSTAAKSQTIVNNNTTVVNRYYPDYRPGMSMGYGMYGVGHYDGWFLTNLLVVDAINDLWWHNHWYDTASRNYARDMDPAAYAALEARVNALEAQGTPRDSTFVHPKVDPDLQYSKEYVEKNPEQFYAMEHKGTGFGTVLLWMLGIAAVGGLGYLGYRRL